MTIPQATNIAAEKLAIAPLIVGDDTPSQRVAAADLAEIERDYEKYRRREPDIMTRLTALAYMERCESWIRKAMEADNAQ